MIVSTRKQARPLVCGSHLSGHENKVAEMIKRRAENAQPTDKILEILIPSQDKIQIKRGQRKTVNEKIFPGYMLVHMQLSDDSWLAVHYPGCNQLCWHWGANQLPCPNMKLKQFENTWVKQHHNTKLITQKVKQSKSLTVHSQTSSQPSAQSTRPKAKSKSWINIFWSRNSSGTWFLTGQKSWCIIFRR